MSGEAYGIEIWFCAHDSCLRLHGFSHHVCSTKRLLGFSYIPMLQGRERQLGVGCGMKVI